MIEAVVLTATEPDTAALGVLFLELGRRHPQLRVATLPETPHLVSVVSPTGTLLTLELPRLVQVPGEAERLLGVTAPVPAWWTVLRAQDDPAGRRVLEDASVLLSRGQNGAIVARP